MEGDDPSSSPFSFQKIESLLGLELADDIGEWVTDGVVPCQLVCKLHPQLMTAFHTPAEGKVRWCVPTPLHLTIERLYVINFTGTLQREEDSEYSQLYCSLSSAPGA